MSGFGGRRDCADHGRTALTSVSHSSLQILQSCPKRYYFAKIEGVKRKGKTRGQRRGSAFSLALEHRSVGQIYDYYDRLIFDASNQILVDDLVIEREVVAALYERHYAEFSDDFREIMFDLPIGDTGYRNRGLIDGLSVIQRDDLGEVSEDELAEDKLMMMWSKADEAALPMNGQVLRYLGAHPTATALVYRVTKYPGTYRKKDEGAKSYSDRVVADVKSKKSDDLFKVIRLERSDIADLITRYYEDLPLRVAEVEWRTATDNWPHAWGDPCKAYGGCEFLPACKREPGFEDLYETKTKDGEAA